MSLRARLTLVAAGVVAVVVVLASATTYFVMRHELESQLDGSLRTTARTVQVERHIGGPGDYGGNLVEEVDTEGNPVAASQGLNLPAVNDSQVRAVARSNDLRDGFYRDIVATYQAPGRAPVHRVLVDLLLVAGQLRQSQRTLAFALSLRAPE